MTSKISGTRKDVATGMIAFRIQSDDFGEIYFVPFSVIKNDGSFKSDEEIIAEAETWQRRIAETRNWHREG